MNIDNCWYKRVCKNECRQCCIRYNSVRSLFEHSELPESLWDYKDLYCTNEDEKAFIELHNIQLNIKDFVNAGDNVYIYSNTCGNGKTSWSIRLLWSYFDSIWDKGGFDTKALFINVPNFLYNCKRSINQSVTGFEELCKNIETVDLVVWDDLPCQQYTGYEHQLILQYIDGRINANKSNIFTGNANKEECLKLMGDKLTSRIFGCSNTIEFVEQDKRGMYNG